ncbi:hypothetical protein LCGC14_0861260 [marine sediment metagenome]|uniref:C2H2-type domain-containing protein n=1 Tax=marine sediment metagenome TaxID=412755 RepID=A0A0F9RS40_9ZZZZ
MGSHNSNQKMLVNRFNCKNCSKGFMMEWARNNHQRLCLEREKAEEKNPQNYV